MAYESIINKTGTPGTGGDPGTGGNPDTSKLVYDVLTPIRPFITDSSDEIITFVKIHLNANTNDNKPGDTISTIKLNDTLASDVIWWRGVSGTPGKFSNYRMVTDVDKYGVNTGVHFEATWGGVGGEPILPIDSTGIIECMYKQPKTDHYYVIKET